ncbi:hypothetical protein AVEN_92120-1 [Araneus ventricosus]|uniref:Uncharacterized protein n=1 Tax=Araneus ventricosus TaxID=182803 RepID=A0A4Y2LFK2_ARAVE|nr:hypothetical protein AVEN_92120-1 [Araneus ventricosus]
MLPGPLDKVIAYLDCPSEPAMGLTLLTESDDTQKLPDRVSWTVAVESVTVDPEVPECVGIDLLLSYRTVAVESVNVDPEFQNVVLLNSLLELLGISETVAAEPAES